MPRHRIIWLSISLVGLSFAPVSPASGQATPSDQFFIVSSIEPAKQQLVVKYPTEVTEVIRVDTHTRYVDRGGNAMALTDLRAGDTVYITSRSKTALEIRKGPMTVAELQRRYLSAKK